MSYEYTDAIGDKLRINSNGYGGATLVAEGKSAFPRKTIIVECADVPTVAAELLKAAGQEGVIVPKATAEVVVVGNGVLECGDGPERAYGSEAENPNWLRNKAANCIAIAEWIEGESAREAVEKAEAEAAEKKLKERRDALAKKYHGRHFVLVGEGGQRVINDIIELQDKLAGASRD